MTMTISSMGQTRVVTEVELVEEAFRALGTDPADLDPGFIPYWLQQGKTLVEIIAIAGEKPTLERRRFPRRVRRTA